MKEQMNDIWNTFGRIDWKNTNKMQSQNALQSFKKRTDKRWGGKGGKIDLGKAVGQLLGGGKGGGGGGRDRNSWGAGAQGRGQRSGQKAKGKGKGPTMNWQDVWS